MAPPLSVTLCVKGLYLISSVRVRDYDDDRCYVIFLLLTFSELLNPLGGESNIFEFTFSLLSCSIASTEA